MTESYPSLPFAEGTIEPSTFALPHLPEVSLPLYRVPTENPRSRRPVLLVHGGSAWSHSFTVPSGQGLADYLARHDFDVFLLDWRASKHVAKRHGPSALAYEATSLDDCAAHDIPAALEEIARLRGDGAKISIVAHCFGAGMTAMAISAGLVEHIVDRVVLLTLGLFYDVAWDGVLKSQDHLLERVRVDEPSEYAVDSTVARFPCVVETAYVEWPKSSLPPSRPEIFRRLAFMFGEPYLAANVPAELHSDAALARQFGPMHLRLFQHGVQNVRRGFAVPFDQTNGGHAVHRYLDTTHWRSLARIQLITGERNGLWHRTAIDSMHEFLLRDIDPAICTKRIVRGYAHQDLLWGRESARDVFPSILDGLRDNPTTKP